jgi:hypothetical protein
MNIEVSGEKRCATKVYNSLHSFKFTKDMFHSVKVGKKTPKIYSLQIHGNLLWMLSWQ